MVDEKKAVDVVFTGLLREPEMFKKTLLDLIEFRKQGLVDKIIFSTWEGEVQKNPEMQAYMKENNIEVLESKEPEVRGLGNVWCQMISFDEALKKTTEGRFVLKTRTDVYINPKFLKQLFIERENVLKITKDLPKGNIFKYKIWIYYYEIKTPFHIGDECFFGYRDDLKHMINYEKKYDTDYRIGGGISHIRRFINPFLKDYPILYRFLETYSKDNPLKAVIEKERRKKKNRRWRVWVRKLPLARKISRNSKFRILHRNLKKEEFLDVLAAYYSILYSHFYVDSVSTENQVTFAGRDVYDVTVDPVDFDSNFTKANFVKSEAGMMHAYDMELLDNVCNKKLKPSPVADKLIEAIDRFNGKEDKN